MAYPERGRIADEYLQAINVLWTEDTPTFTGRFVSFDGIAFEPRPRRGAIPIWIGGNSEAALRRAVRFGTGWRPWQVGLEELPAWVEKIRRLTDEFERRDPLQLHVLATPLGVGDDHKPLADGAATKGWSTQALVDRIGRLQELGVTWTTLPISEARTLDEYLDQI